jgi:hypothetical protein
MDDLVKALRSGEQADMDGTLVKVSRQACEEAADAIESLQAQLAEARDKALEDAAVKATGFLIGNPEHGSPLRNPMSHEIAAAIRAMKGERG